ncbi:aminoglycoside 3-N-acetyltransferase [Morganella morganii]|uniref:aminoglycoside 3-N-acetyltransferase n=1 Tax=Morganella morganii TaxID=582 RepID=UPI00236798B5|nr:aminoglycoside 3-N-acetyltransferase [Morganella morganii]
MQKMIAVGDEYYWSQPVLAEQLRVLGLQPGDAVMVHASLRAAGPCLNGADDLIDALLQCTGENGTLLCYVNWLENYEDSTGDDGCVPAVLKPLITPFDVRTSRANPDHGVFAECFRTRPGALRSANPGASVAAIGAKAAYFTENHPLCYGYGEDSPFARLVAEDGKVLMLGAPADTMSLLHHAESIAPLRNKRIRRKELPLRRADGSTDWVMSEEFDTADPVCDCFPEGYFAQIVADFSQQNNHLRRGNAGSAGALLVSARQIRDFAVSWMMAYQHNAG